MLAAVSVAVSAAPPLTIRPVTLGPITPLKVTPALAVEKKLPTVTVPALFTVAVLLRVSDAPLAPVPRIRLFGPAIGPVSVECP